MLKYQYTRKIISFCVVCESTLPFICRLSVMLCLSWVCEFSSSCVRFVNQEINSNNVKPKEWFKY